MTQRAKRAAEELRAFGLTYPGAHLKSPWPDHLDLAVNDKTFAYLSTSGKPFAISCKLPKSAEGALSLPFSSPTSYGLGKWGWVTATVAKGDIPVALFKEWIDESYRAQAPRRLVKQLPPLPPTEPRADHGAKSRVKLETQLRGHGTSLLSKLGRREQARLLTNLNYLNLQELRSLCRKHGIPYKIVAETSPGEFRTTTDTDRKPVALGRVRHYFETGEVLPATCIVARVVRSEAAPEQFEPGDRIYYRWYDKRHRGLLRALQLLTKGRFRDGAVARVLIMDFWTSGKAPSCAQFAKAWLAGKSREHELLTPEYAYLSDLKRGHAGVDWKRIRKQKAAEALRILDKL